uniref:G1/S-specific cyclin-E (inferred by orthology to a D. melanogaster protein) n=1 Tax=Strongyloides venezuelensis TaxID=75913 RepID=A0A0K0F2F9_STRVS
MDSYPEREFNTRSEYGSSSSKSRKRAFEEVNYDTPKDIENGKPLYSDLSGHDISDDRPTHYSPSLSPSPLKYNSLRCNEEVQSPGYCEPVSNDSFYLASQSDKTNSYNNLNSYQMKKQLPFESVMLRQTNTVYGKFEYIINYDKKSKEYQRKIREKYPHEIYIYGQSHEVIDLLYLKSRIYPSLEAKVLPIDKKLNGTYRLAILEWLQEICYEEHLSRMTYNSAINIMDRFMAENPVNPRYYQLISATCLLIAAKIEEIYPPTFSKLVDYSGGAYCLTQLKRAEIAIVNELQFALNPITCYTFLTYFHLKLQDEYDEPLEDETMSPDILNYSSPMAYVRNLANRSNSDLNHFYTEKPRIFSSEVASFFIRTMAIHDFIFMTDNSSFFSPSKLAAAIVYAQIPDENLNLSNLVNYTKDEVLEEINYVLPFVENSKHIELDYKEKILLLSDSICQYKKYDIQTSSPSFRMVLFDNDKLNDHIIKFNQKTKTLPLKL